MKNKAVFFLVTVVLLVGGKIEAARSEQHLYVDWRRGSDRAAGIKSSPFRTIYAAIKRLPKEIDQDVTIHLTEGNYNITGQKGSSAGYLELNCKMSNGARVQIVGNKASFDEPSSPGKVVLNWQSKSSDFLILVTDGYWRLANVQLGTRKSGQRGGISVAGPALLELQDVRIHTIGQKGPGLRAHHGGRINLYGNIELNEDLRESGGDDESFCRIEAEYAGVVKFIQGKGASLKLGNGNLSASYYGIIELGCEKASITSWNYQSNPIAVNNSGRVDLHNTTTTLCARNPRNTPIGLEHDGHVLAEGARIIINGQGNSNAIVLQKASSFFCNDVEIHGEIRHPLLAMSGSVMLVGFNGDLGETFATTCSSIIIEKCTGRLLGPFKETKFGQIVLPEGKAIGVTKDTASDEPNTDSGDPVMAESIDVTSLPPLHRAAYGGHIGRMKQLIEQGFNIMAKGPSDWTPLHMAAMGGHQLMAKLLLNKGADIHARDDKGRTAVQLAEVYGHSGLAAFLRSKEPASN